MDTGTLMLFAGEFHARMVKNITFLKWMPFEDYHGFGKYRVRLGERDGLLALHGLNPELCQVEIIRVDRDLSDELHHHDQSDAAIIVLGAQVGLEDPRNAFAYLGDRWQPVAEGAIALIPAGKTHGFKVEDGGILYFLSVQIPPIVGHHGDDYVKDA